MLTPFMPNLLLGPNLGYRGPGSTVLNSTTTSYAFRIVPGSSWTATTLAQRFAKVGSPTSCTATVTIQTESSFLPSGTAVTNGTATVALAATGWYTFTFPSTGPSLTAGVAYWIVISISSTGTLDSVSNYYDGYAALDNSNCGSFERQFTTYSSGAWQTATYNKSGAGFLFTTNLGTWGNVYHNSSNTPISGTTRVGIKCKVMVPSVITGFWTWISVNGSGTVPNLVASIFQDGTNVQFPASTSWSWVKSVMWGGYTSYNTLVPLIFDFGQNVTLNAGDYWVSLLANPAGANNWEIATMQEDYDTTGAASRGGSDWLLGTRTADTGSWTMYSPVCTPYFGLLLASESPTISGGGGSVIGSSMISNKK